MKKFLAALLVLTLLVATVAFAADKFVKFTGTAYGYETRGAHKTSLAIKKGSIAKLHHWNADNSWVKVYAGNHALWFKGKYVKDAPKATAAKIVYSAGGTQQSKEAGSEEKVSGYKRVKAIKNVNIRATASLQGKSLGTLKKGKWMTFKGVKKADSRGVYFYKIITNKGVIGWVSEAYTELLK